jgi:hypothetical protein
MADTFKVERSATIAAPADVVFGFINDFHQWTLWSPWEKLDVELERSYSGPDAGVGAHYGWNGKKSGAGTMDIIASDPATMIGIDLKFTKPFKAENDTRFVLTPEGDATRVVWTMTGKSNLMHKVMGLFMNMDKMVGGSFEEGLASLKAISEAKQAAA